MHDPFQNRNPGLIAIGQQIKSLLVLSPTRKDSNYRQYWNCRCKCGNLVEVREDNLKAGRANSCGCMRNVKTVGLPNQKSSRNQTSDALYRVDCWHTKPHDIGNGKKVIRYFATVRKGDDPFPEHDVMDMRYTKPIGGQVSPCLAPILRRMAKAGYIGAQNGRTVSDWLDEEQVAWNIVHTPSYELISAVRQGRIDEAEAAGFDSQNLEARADYGY